MNISKKEYSDLAKKASPPSPKLKNCLWAFFVGGTICSLGQLFFEILTRNGVEEKTPPFVSRETNFLPLFHVKQLQRRATMI